MKRKTIPVVLIFLLFLPAMGFTGDVEITDVKLKWIDGSIFGPSFRAKIQVRNTTNKDYEIFGVITFYDADGFKLRDRSFKGEVEAGESKILYLKGHMFKSEYEDLEYYEVTINRKRRRP